jgi:hypothetical protein
MAEFDPAIHRDPERVALFLDGRIKCGHDSGVRYECRDFSERVVLEGRA